MVRRYGLLILILFFFFTTSFAQRPNTLKFHVLPETAYYGGIQSITKDSLGRIWYTGPDAIFMYDGNNFHPFNDAVDSKKSNIKWSFGDILTTTSGELFLATNQALLTLDYKKLVFNEIFPGAIRSFCVDEHNNLYFLTADSIYYYDVIEKSTTGFLLPKIGNVAKLLFLSGEIYATSANKIYRIDFKNKRIQPFCSISIQDLQFIDGIERDGYFYFLTRRNGIFILDKKGKYKSHIDVVVDDKKDVLAKKIVLGERDVIWVATQQGLFFYDVINNKSWQELMNLRQAGSLPNNSIWTIFRDPIEGMWIGTYGGKIAYSSSYDPLIRYFKPSPIELNHPIVSSFAEDHLGNIWVGTEGGGLNYWNRSLDHFTYFLSLETNSEKLNMIKRIRFNSKDKELFVSAFNQGVLRYDFQSNKFLNLGFYFPESRHAITAYDYFEDKDGTWWITDPNQTFFYRKKDNQKIEIVRAKNKEEKTLDLHIQALYEDKEGHLRLITQEGFYVVNKSSLSIIDAHIIDNPSYNANYLCSYLISSNGDVWLGTMGRGVNVLKKDGRYINYSDKNGFPAAMVFGLLEDDAHNIWLTTSDGLYVYYPQRGVFEKSNFYNKNACGAFYLRAAFKTSKGELLFGGTNGFMLLDPIHSKSNPHNPKVFFTAFHVNNKLMDAHTKESPLVYDISYLANHVNHIVKLSSKESNIEIWFSADSYLQSEKNQFVYRMKGLDDQWSSVNQGQKSVRFFDLPSGDYVFEIKAANNDGLWGDEVSKLYIHVDPPFFLSWWAYTFYALIGFAILYFIMRYYTHKKMFQERLALEAKKEQHMLALNKARNDFFTHISHDLKTPLTLVKEPLKLLKESMERNDQTVGYFQLIERNITRIQRMISQLLRFREIESQKITLHPQLGDFVSFVSEVFHLFEWYASKKQIETSFYKHTDHEYVAFDYDILEKILTNLFSNALKYTPEKGFVSVRIYSSLPNEIELLEKENTTAEYTHLSVEVLNSADNFTEQEVNKLFKAFERLNSDKPTFQESSGLGLAIVKELVDVLKGNIRIENKSSAVSFTLTLPLKKGQVTNDLAYQDAYDYTISELDQVMLEGAYDLPNNKNYYTNKSQSILLIEDEPELLSYMQEALSRDFDVYTAVDGTEGIIKAEKLFPQIIITDLMMPNTDGFEVCRHLRENFKTSHIPIVMVSGAGEENQNKVKALKYGATVFVDKPFEMNYLMTQIHSILKSQQELKELYSKRLVIDPSKVTMTSIDEELLVKAMQYIEQNMSNQYYSVENFVSDMGVGRTILYQKINDIVGMSIKEFILNIRLKRSADLLAKSDLTIAQIAYQTGFNNAKYFSVCFKKQFDISPSEYRKSTFQA